MARNSTWQLLVIALAVGIAGGLVVGTIGQSTPWIDDQDTQQPTDTDPGPHAQANESPLDDHLNNSASVRQFGSTEAFQEYVRAGADQVYAGGGGLGMSIGTPMIEPQIGGTTVEPVAVDAVETAPTVDSGAQAGDAPNRIGETNVQVSGLDEPDIVKTDGSNFYFGATNPYPYIQPVEPGPITDDSRLPPERQQPQTNVIDASEPEDPDAIATIDARGELIQTGDTLVVFQEQTGHIVGYDVSEPSNPSEAWNRSLDDRLVTAREAGGTLYVVTETPVGPEPVCPIEPVGEVAIDCGSVYAPTTETAADGTYTALSIDASSGEVDDHVSFVGTGSGTVVSMFPDSLYVTYTTGVAMSDLAASWTSDSDIVPASLAERIQEINSYDISETSKQREIARAVEQAGEGDGSGVNVTQLREDFQSYTEARQEELTQTGIVRVDVDDTELSVGETGSVPGRPLNQFALDEYEGTLRIATTIPRVGDAQSTNSLYVLDNRTLEQEDTINGMGEGQEIYSVRYEGDRAYVVTFRQIDPFYVIDFDDPRDPELLGELELPGFSSYLHEIDEDTVLGIGEEDGQTKAALFDVSDPTNPTVADDLVLDSYWSAIEDSHHAFMLDRRHEVFFLPSGDSAKIVDYSGGDLEVVMSVEAEQRVTRARYVEDSLYIFAGSEVIVVDETSWERTTTLELDR